MEYIGTLLNYVYDIWYIMGSKNQTADAEMGHSYLRLECCQVSQCWLTWLVIQPLTEWFWDVTIKMKDNSWCNNIVQILVSKDCQEHLPKASPAAMQWNVWAHSHHFTVDDGLLYLDHQTQHPERPKDKPHWLYIPIPIRIIIHREVHDTTLGGHIGAA